MLNADDLRSRAKQSPFVPFRITTSAGETFDVPHPDMVLVGRREVIVGIPGADGSTYHEQIARVGILHITSLKDLPVPVAPSA